MNVCVVSQCDRQRSAERPQARAAAAFCVNTINCVSAVVNCNCEQLKNFGNWNKLIYILVSSERSVFASAALRWL